VGRFEEKPTPERATELISVGAAYWNAGIFVWQRATAVAGLAQYAPDIDAPIRDWMASAGTAVGAGWPGAAMAETYAALRGTSVDYALLEPASLDARVAVVPAAIGWSDLGSWSALSQYRGGQGAPVLDIEGTSRVIDVEGRDVYVHAAGGRLVAVVGLDGIVIVDTPDALLVTSAQAAENVKKVVDRLRDEGRDDLL
jgi:mannose-1-phosphate guanylyltransferase